MRVMTANNDAQVRVFDIEKFACLFESSVNNTSVSPDGKLLAVLGDSADYLIADAQSGKAVGGLKGHLGCWGPQRALRLLLFFRLAPGWTNLGYGEPRHYL